MFFNSEKKVPHDTAQQLQDADKLLATLSPVVSANQNSRVSFVLGQGADYIGEFLCYIVSLACFGFLFLMSRVYPFYMLSEIVNKRAYIEAMDSKADMDAFEMAIKALVVIIGLLFLLIGMNKRKTRQTRTLLRKSAIELKNIESYFISKKIELEKLLPATSTPVDTAPETLTKTNESLTNKSSQ